MNADGGRMFMVARKIVTRVKVWTLGLTLVETHLTWCPSYS